MQKESGDYSVDDWQSDASRSVSVSVYVYVFVSGCQISFVELAYTQLAARWLGETHKISSAGIRVLKWKLSLIFTHPKHLWSPDHNPDLGGVKTRDVSNLLHKHLDILEETYPRVCDKSLDTLTVQMKRVF